MDVWVVTDETRVSTTVLAVFLYAPTEEDLAGLGPLQQDFSETVDARGRPYTRRVVTPMVAYERG